MGRGLFGGLVRQGVFTLPVGDLFQESLPPQGPAARDALRCGSPLGTVRRTLRLASDAWSATGSHDQAVPACAGPQTVTLCPWRGDPSLAAYGRQGGVVAPGSPTNEVPRPPSPETSLNTGAAVAVVKEIGDGVRGDSNP